eukprot:g4739.t1
MEKYGTDMRQRGGVAGGGGGGPSPADTSSSSSTPNVVALRFGLWASRAIEAIGAVLGCFKAADRALLGLAHETLQVTSAVLTIIPNHDQYRSRTIALLHRCSWAFSSGDARLVASLLACLAPLILHEPGYGGESDTLAVIQLVNMIIRRTANNRGAVAPVVDAVLLPMCKSVFASLPKVEDPVDARSLGLVYYQFLHFVFTSFRAVATNPKHAPHLQSIFATILQGCASDVPGCAKVCYKIWIDLIKAWCPPSGNAATSPVAEISADMQRGFVQFVFGRVIAVMFEAPANPDFDLEDAKCAQVLTEIARLMLLLVDRFGIEKYSTYLRDDFFARRRYPQQAVGALLAVTHQQHAAATNAGTKDDGIKGLRRGLRMFFAATTRTA